jgi:hypothetical protein
MTGFEFDLIGKCEVVDEDDNVELVWRGLNNRIEEVGVSTKEEE